MSINKIWFENLPFFCQLESNGVNLRTKTNWFALEAPCWPVDAKKGEKKYSYGKCWIEGGQLKSYKVKNKFSAETVLKESLDLRKARVSCHFLHFAQTEDICLKSSIEREEDISLSTGSNPRTDALWFRPGRGFADPKTGGLQYKDRRVQTIIGEIILQTWPSPKEFFQDNISTSNRNLQNRSRKWWYFSLEGLGQYLHFVEKKGQGNMIIDTWPEWGIGREGKQVKFGK